MKIISQPITQCTCLIASIGMLASAPAALAWGDGGHMMVAEIAYQNLNPVARTNINALLGTNGIPGSTNEFIHASHWADDVKHTSAFSSTADEHFIDFPFSPDQTPLPADLPKAVNITNALHEHLSVLKDSNAKVESRIEAAKFIIHLVGDIHQPLHCATRVTQNHPHGDTGGNGFPLKDPNKELHSLWDSGLHQFPRELAGFQPPPLDQVHSAVQNLATAFDFTAEKTACAQNGLDIGAWAQESSQLAQTNAYVGITENQKPSADYLKKSELAQKRVIWAGFRLAALLNSVWTDN
jgi:S1/P1 nuclease